MQITAVIRYPVFLESKNPEAFAHSNLMLFHPWRKEEDDLLSNFSSYTAHYAEVKEKLLNQKETLQHHGEIIQNALEQFQENGPPIDSWQTVAAQTVQDSMDMTQEGTQLHPDHQILLPEDGHDIEPFNIPVPTLPPQLAIESRPELIPDDDYRAHVRSLNEQQ